MISGGILAHRLPREKPGIVFFKVFLWKIKVFAATLLTYPTYLINVPVQKTGKNAIKHIISEML